jgi:NAD(P)-dependent dehydrogenase (short-subunit alcohol dehydrogenase family)
MNLQLENKLELVTGSTTGIGFAIAKAFPPAAPEHWLEAQKQRLKQGQLDEVLAALSPHQESPATPDANAPVRRCYRYITHRPGQFDYPAALAAGLPLGSGQIESAHRYVIQIA